jgi:NTP-dependent ternary system trypsin peptidase co-occuring protein
LRVTDDSVPAKELIRIIKNSIKRAGVSSTSEKADLQVTAVKLILHVVAINTVGGGLDIRVPVVGMRLKMGGKLTRQDTHTIDITLEPPTRLAGHELRDGKVEDTLVKAITTIRAVVADAAEGDDPWVLRTGSVDISFAVTDAGNLSVGIEDEFSSELNHTLRLDLAAIRSTS